MPGRYRRRVGDRYMREIVVDTETTGLDPQAGHRIVEIGCIELSNHVQTGRTYRRSFQSVGRVDVAKARSVLYCSGALNRRRRVSAETSPGTNNRLFRAD